MLKLPMRSPLVFESTHQTVNSAPKASCERALGAHAVHCNHAPEALCMTGGKRTFSSHGVGPGFVHRPHHLRDLVGRHLVAQLCTKLRELHVAGPVRETSRLS